MRFLANSVNWQTSLPRSVAMMATIVLGSAVLFRPSAWSCEDHDGKAPVALKAALDASPSQPPSPLIAIPSQQPVAINRTIPDLTGGSQALGFSDPPTNSEIMRYRVFPERLLPLGATSPEDNRALAAALRGYPATVDPLALEGLAAFIAEHPQSPWQVALLTNAGIVYRRHGFFSRAMQCWRTAWDMGRTSPAGAGHPLVDLAVAELAQVNAWVGRSEALDQIFAEIGSRELMGIAREKLDGARRGRQNMAGDAGQSFKCGPYAVDRIRRQLTGDQTINARIVDFQTAPQGTHLAQLKDLAAEMGLPMQVVRGYISAALPVPAVIHWKLNHFSALLRIEGDRCLVQDNTMDSFYGREEWIPLQALQEEASGNYLIAAGSLPQGFTSVTDAEAKTIFGRGDTGTITDTLACGPCDNQSGGDKPRCGMAGYSFHTMLVSLRVEDMPLFYAPPRGGTMGFRVSYNEKESTQPAVFTYANFGSRWTFNWIDFITDDPANTAVSQKLEQATAGGGGYRHVLTAGLSAPQPFTGNVLRKTGPSSYEIIHPDGSRSEYTQADGIAYPRRIFLTRVIDPANNAIEIHYQQASAGLRLAAIVDSLGQVSTFAYGHADPLKITAISDPFGRSATFTYGANGQLESITDAVGLTSSFAYASGDAISALTTPYGTTSFKRGTGVNSQRWIEATDPLGDTERLEFVHRAAGMPIPHPMPAPQTGDLLFDGNWQYYRNSFYWDKKAHRLAKGIYTKAVIYHWLHQAMDTINYGGTSRLLQGMKRPLEGYEWYQYPGQNQFLNDSGITVAKPRLVARVLDDLTTTQRSRFTYSTTGQVTSIVDPLGRTTEIQYAGNGIDVSEVRQRINPTTTETIGSATYDARHLPLTITDAARQITTCTYNGFGQLETLTNSKGEVTTFIYDALGYLTTVRGATGVDGTIGYDGFGRPRVSTGTDGYQTVTDYDALNRTLRVTYPDTTYEQVAYRWLDVEWIRDRQGRWTHHFHDSLRRLAATRDPLGRITLISWCRCGQPNAITDPLNRVTRWAMDLQGRVTTKTYPDGKEATSVYQPMSGRLGSTTDAMGQVTSYQYFLDDKLKQITYTSAARPTPGVSFTYDAAYGRMQTLVDGTGTTTYSYHPITAAPGTLGAGQVSSIDGPLDNDTANFIYDELGRSLTRTLGLGATAVSYAQTVSYDALGRVSAQANELGSFGYLYQGATGRLREVTLPGGMKTTLDYLTATGDFRLQGISHTRSGGALIASHAYTYSPAGAITSWALQTDTAGASTFQFTNDETDQLRTAVRSGALPTGAPATSAFRYDTAGNRTTTQLDKVVQTHAYNTLNQLTQTTAGGLMRVEGHLDELAQVTVNGAPARVTADKKFTAEVPVTPGNNTLTIQATDANGNQREKIWDVTGITGATASPTYDFNGNCLSDGVRTYEWDANDRMTAIIIGPQRSELTYDGMGRRVRIVEKTNGTVTSDRRFVWIGAEIVQERDSANAVTKRFSGHGALGSAGVVLYLRDHLGSVREVMDTAGAVRARYDYEVYGKQRKISGDLEAEFGFTGHYQHVPSGLALTWFRAYDPGTGRWMSRDPIGEAGGLNLYGYVGNRPSALMDPFGLCDEDLGIGYFGFIDGLTFGAASWLTLDPDERGILYDRPSYYVGTAVGAVTIGVVSGGLGTTASMVGNVTRAGAAARGVAAMSASEMIAILKWAGKRSLNAQSATSQFLWANRSMKVGEFMSKYMKGSAGRCPNLQGNWAEMTVEEALKNETLRKLLTQLRFGK